MLLPPIPRPSLYVLLRLLPPLRFLNLAHVPRALLLLRQLNRPTPLPFSFTAPSEARCRCCSTFSTTDKRTKSSHSGTDEAGEGNVPKTPPTSRWRAHIGGRQGCWFRVPRWHKRHYFTSTSVMYAGREVLFISRSCDETLSTIAPTFGQ